MRNIQHIGKRFEFLLERFHAGDCTSHEINELKAFFNDEDLSSEIKDHMFSVLDQQNSNQVTSFDSNYLLYNMKLQIVENKYNDKKRLFSHLVRFLPAAAIVIMLFVVGGLVAYFANSNAVVDTHPVSFCEVVAPMGAKSKFVLPDSSTVWLNEGSRLTYSTTFNSSNRFVHLDGEAYFQVSKNNKLPFVVDAFGFLIEGEETEFNVKAYENEPTIVTTLVEGKVWLNHRTETIASDIFLGRKYKATFFKQQKGTVLNPCQPRLVISPNIDPKPLISWKNDRSASRKNELLENMIESGQGDILVRLWDLTLKNKVLKVFPGLIIAEFSS